MKRFLFHSILKWKKISFYFIPYGHSDIETISLKKNLPYFFHLLQTHLLCSSKKIENLRFCVDYNNLNFITIKNRYFISLIKQLLNCLIEIATFTKLNIHFAYNALRIQIDDKWKTIFRFKYEHFEYRVMFFKLTKCLSEFSIVYYFDIARISKHILNFLFW